MMANKEKHGIDFHEAQHLSLDPERIVVPASFSADEFDSLFDEGGEVVEYLAMEKAERPGLKQRRVSVDFPAWLVQELDREDKRQGITRQSVTKYWISEKLHPSVE